MGTSANLIPRNRLKWIPRTLRLAHEYSFFLHDECVRALRDYEGADAHVVTISFRDKAEADLFNAKADADGPIAAMRVGGYETEARRVIINKITMAMVSDCLHHIYEALRCLEKRKLVVAANLLRKPLTDNLLYLSWILGDEDGFYKAFSTNSPNSVTSKTLKQRRTQILSDALARTRISSLLDSEFVDETLFDRGNPYGLQMLFQHAVHLITVDRIELRTSPENFNFIFANLEDDDNYHALYSALPDILLYLSHIIMGLFERMHPPEGGSMAAFEARSMLGHFLLEDGEKAATALDILGKMSPPPCDHCGKPLRITHHNAVRMVLSESTRCTNCRMVQAFPFSWMFDSQSSRGR